MFPEDGSCISDRQCRKRGSMETQKGFGYICDTLCGYGIDHVFLQEAILRRTLVELEKRGVKRVVTHSEIAAAYMADGYARARLKPSVCMCQSVGAANLAAGLQDAYLGSSPVVAITGKKLPIFQYRSSYQEIDHIPLFNAVTKYNVSCDTVEQLPHLLRQAFRMATTGCPGPVHIDVTDNLGAKIESAAIAEATHCDSRFAAVPPFRIDPENEDIENAVRLLKESQRPVIVAGRGCILSGAEPLLMNLAEMIQIPVATTVDGKGSVINKNHLSIGCVGDYSVPCANSIVAKADLVIFIGTKANDQATLNWTVPSAGTKVVQIDINPCEIGKNYPNTAGILSDARKAVCVLTERLRGFRVQESWTRHARKVVDDWEKEMAPLWKSNQVPIRPERLCNALSESLPDNSILVSDTGYSAIWSAGHVYINKPGQSYMRAAGGSLGWSFPASLGVQCGRPDKKVICFCGDGAFWYHIGELETQARHNIKSVTVINNNGGYGQCRPNILKTYGSDSGRHEDLWKFSKVDISKIAAEIGLFTVKIDRPDKLEGAIEKAITSDKPALVEVVTDIEITAPLGQAYKKL